MEEKPRGPHHRPASLVSILMKYLSLTSCSEEMLFTSPKKCDLFRLGPFLEAIEVTSQPTSDLEQRPG